MSGTCADNLYCHKENPDSMNHVGHCKPNNCTTKEDCFEEDMMCEFKDVTYNCNGVMCEIKDEKCDCKGVKWCEKQCGDYMKMKLTDCFCKNGQCKKNFGCGTDRTWGGGWLRECSDCQKDDCEDEGKCMWKKGECVSKVKPPQTTTTSSPQPLNSDGPNRNCRPCYRVKCRENPKVEDCLSGQLDVDDCGCCKRCAASAKDEKCGGMFGMSGTCADNLYCHKENPDSMNHVGHCKPNNCTTKEDCFEEDMMCEFKDVTYNCNGVMCEIKDEKCDCKGVKWCEKQCGDYMKMKLTDCFCKNGQCKKNFGCGTDRTWGGGRLRKCSDCEKDDCEDEGKCTWKKGKCRYKGKCKWKNGKCKVKRPQATSIPSLQPDGPSRNCRPCYRVKCRENPKVEDCLTGQLDVDDCGCCKRCASAENESCGGRYHAACADNLHCQKDDCEDEEKCKQKTGKCVSKVKPPQAPGYFTRNSGNIKTRGGKKAFTGKHYLLELTPKK